MLARLALVAVVDTVDSVAPIEDRPFVVLAPALVPNTQPELVVAHSTLAVELPAVVLASC